MKALVTGGLGFIGSNLVDMLVSRGYNVYVVDDMSSGNKSWANKKASSSSCYSGKFMNPYTFSKKISEEMCEMYSRVFAISTVTARFFNVYGPRNPLIGEYTPIIAKFEQLKKQGKPLTVVGDGEQRRDFTHVYDICEGLISLSKDKWRGQIFNLGTGTNYSINELVDMFECDRVYLPSRPGEAKETKADITETLEKTDWRPKYNLKDYIDEIKELL